MGGGEKPTDKIKQDTITNITEPSKPKIYDPLPDKYKSTKFRNSTGFAYVSKSSSGSFKYQKFINGKNIQFKGSTIEELYSKVSAKKLPWGVYDYEKASKIISIPEDILSKYTSKKSEVNGKQSHHKNITNKNNNVILTEYLKNMIPEENRIILQDVFIKQGVLYSSKSRVANMQLPAINHLKNNLNRYVDENYTLHDIYDELQEKELYPKIYSASQMEKYLWNILNGTFDEVLVGIVEDIITHPFFKNYKVNSDSYNIKGCNAEGVFYYGNYGFNVYDLIYIRNKLDLYHNQQYKNIMISQDSGVFDAIDRVLFNLGNGYFDKYMKQFEDTDKYDLKGILAPKYQKHYDKIYNYELINPPSFWNNAFYFKHSPLNHITVEEAINIKEEYNKSNSLRNLFFTLPFSNDRIFDSECFGVFVYNLKEGYFDNIIKESKNNRNYDGFYEYFENYIGLVGAKSYIMTSYSTEFKLMGNEAIASHEKIYLMMDDIIYIKEHLSDFINNNKFIDDIFEEIDSHMSFSKPELSKLIYNVYQGFFDELIEEYKVYLEWLNQDHLFETDGVKLSIDGEDTNLTLAKVNLIYFELDDSEEKQRCLHNHMLSYDTVDDKYIHLIHLNYDNNVFRKLLKQDNPRKIVINNPQKRRERCLC